MLRKRLFWMLAMAAIACLCIFTFIWFQNINSEPEQVREQTRLTVPSETRYAPATIMTAQEVSQRLSIKGAGTPLSAVTIFSGGLPFLTTKVDAQGAWSANLSLPHPDERSELLVFEMTSRLVDGTDIRSGESLMIVTHMVQGVAKIGVLLGVPGAATRILQSPFSGAPSRDGLSVNVAEYDNAGGVIFSGQSTKPGRIRVLTNNAVVGETGLTQDGGWSIIAGSTLPVGVYRLRVLRLSAGGTVDTGLELPFERAAPHAVDVTPDLETSQISNGDGEGSDGSDVQTSSFQPKLRFETDYWHLSRRLYGGGFQHTVIYNPLAVIR